MRLYLAHGKESSPWGTKMIALADVAKAKGFDVVIPDYSELADPDARVARLIDLCGKSDDTTVLVGSSMGGYVSTVTSSVIKPDGLFLLAPAFYLPGYQVQEPVPCCRQTVIVHGWNDQIVPVDHSLQFAREHGCELHLLDADHRLMSQLPLIEKLFALFLDEILRDRASAETSRLKRLRWRDIASIIEGALQDLPHKDQPCLDSVQRLWARIEAQGEADYTTEDERCQVAVRVLAVIHFYRRVIRFAKIDFVAFCDGMPDCDGNCPCERYEMEQPDGDKSDVMVEKLNLLLAQMSNVNQLAGNDRKTDTPMDLRHAVERALHEVIYPAIRKEYDTASLLAMTLYSIVTPAWWELGDQEFLADPEESVSETSEVEDSTGYKGILAWVERNLSYGCQSALKIDPPHGSQIDPSRCKSRSTQDVTDTGGLRFDAGQGSYLEVDQIVLSQKEIMEKITVPEDYQCPLCPDPSR